MNNKSSLAYPKGYFPLHISVCDRCCRSVSENKDECTENLTAKILNRFISFAKGKYDLHVILQPENKETQQAEALIAVPFPDRENIRIDFNIFASEVDREYNDDTRFEFRMESAY